MAAESDQQAVPAGRADTALPESVERGTTTGKAGRVRRRGHRSRAPLFIRRNPALHMTWQVFVLLVGVAIVAGGIAMLVLPGPGWVAIFLGLAVLGTEFVWAQRVLHWAKRQAQKAADKALDPRTRRRNVFLLIAGLVLAAAGVGVYIQQAGMRLPW